jgi:hypothetical protein
MLNNTLKTIINDEMALLQLIEELSGETTEITEKWWMEIENNLASKVDSYSSMEMMLADRAAAQRAKANKFMDAAKSLENMHERLRERIKEAMRIKGTMELRGNDYYYRLAARAPKLVIDELYLPNCYRETMTIYQVNKDRIKEELQKGFKVDGARLESVFSLTCAINKESKR